MFFLTLFFFYFYFFSLFSNCWWNKSKNKGKLGFFGLFVGGYWVDTLWFLFLMIIKNQSKSASLNIKSNLNQTLLEFAVDNGGCSARCLGFPVLPVVLKRLTWFPSVVWLCSGINKKWGMTHFLPMGQVCVTCMRPRRRLCFHVRWVSSKNDLHFCLGTLVACLQFSNFS